MYCDNVIFPIEKEVKKLHYNNRKLKYRFRKNTYKKNLKKHEELLFNSYKKLETIIDKEFKDYEKIKEIFNSDI